MAQEMRVDLVELLRTREICHPSRIVGIDSKCAGDLRISVTGPPWWLRTPPAVTEANITFHMEGILEGSLMDQPFIGDHFREDLECFDVRPLGTHEWAKGDHCDLYCSAPLAEPFAIYASLHDALLDLDCPYPPERYLNMGASGSLAEFAAITSSRSYLLFSGPDALCQIVREALERAGTRFNVLSRDNPIGSLKLVRIERSWLLCIEAYAVY